MPASKAFVVLLLGACGVTKGANLNVMVLIPTKARSGSIIALAELEFRWQGVPVNLHDFGVNIFTYQTFPAWEPTNSIDGDYGKGWATRTYSGNSHKRLFFDMPPTRTFKGLCIDQFRYVTNHASRNYDLLRWDLIGCPASRINCQYLHYYYFGDAPNIPNGRMRPTAWYTINFCGQGSRVL